jgi:hypothetical protein
MNPLKQGLAMVAVLGVGAALHYTTGMRDTPVLQCFLTADDEEARQWFTDDLQKVRRTLARKTRFSLAISAETTAAYVHQLGRATTILDERRTSHAGVSS